MCIRDRNNCSIRKFCLSSLYFPYSESVSYTHLDVYKRQTLHLLYSRFWHQFLYDIGAVPTPEPYLKRTSHGMILGENGEKMSKSRGNVVNLSLIHI